MFLVIACSNTQKPEPHTVTRNCQCICLHVHGCGCAEFSDQSHQAVPSMCGWVTGDSVVSPSPPPPAVSKGFGYNGIHVSMYQKAINILMSFSGWLGFSFCYFVLFCFFVHVVVVSAGVTIFYNFSSNPVSKVTFPTQPHTCTLY